MTEPEPSISHPKKEVLQIKDGIWGQMLTAQNKKSVPNSSSFPRGRDGANIY